MSHLVISVGSNCNQRRENVASAIEWLAGLLENFRASTIYETACALKKGHTYMNAVVAGDYPGDSALLDKKFKEYEMSNGRDENCRRRGEVPVDIDIVVEDGEVLKPWDFRQKFFTIGFNALQL